MLVMLVMLVMLALLALLVPLVLLDLPVLPALLVLPVLPVLPVPLDLLVLLDFLELQELPPTPKLVLFSFAVIFNISSNLTDHKQLTRPQHMTEMTATSKKPITSPTPYNTKQPPKLASERP